MLKLSSLNDGSSFTFLINFSKTEANPENVKEIEKHSFRNLKSMTPNSYQRNRDAKVKKTQATCTNESITLPPAETLFKNGQNSAPLTTGTDKLQVQKNEGNFTAMINLFHNNIKGGPAYICICCDSCGTGPQVTKCQTYPTKPLHRPMFFWLANFSLFNWLVIFFCFYEILLGDQLQNKFAWDFNYFLCCWLKTPNRLRSG